MPGIVCMDLTKRAQTPPASDIKFYTAWEGGQKADGSWWGDCAKVVLVFSLRALDGATYHISSKGWANYTEYDPEEDYHSRLGLPPLVRFMARESGMHMGHVGEAVFYQDIPLSFLEAIWVHPEIAAALRESLEREGISHINGRPARSVLLVAP